MSRHISSLFPKLMQEEMQTSNSIDALRFELQQLQATLDVIAAKNTELHRRAKRFGLEFGLQPNKKDQGKVCHSVRHRSPSPCALFSRHSSIVQVLDRRFSDLKMSAELTLTVQETQNEIDRLKRENAALRTIIKRQGVGCEFGMYKKDQTRDLRPNLSEPRLPWRN